MLWNVTQGFELGWILKYTSSDGMSVALNQWMILHTFFYRNGNADHHLGTSFFVCKGIIIILNACPS
jgi:hypothetical protein